MKPTLFRQFFLVLTAVLLLMAVGSVGLLGWYLTDFLQVRFERDVAQSLAVLGDELQRTDERIQSQLDVADAALTSRGGIQDESMALAGLADDLRARTDLDILDIVTSDGTVISSAHWPERIGTEDPDDRHQLATEAPFMLRREQGSQGFAVDTFLTLQGIRPVSGDLSAVLVGGYRVTDDTLSRWGLLSRGTVEIRTSEVGVASGPPPKDGVWVAPDYRSFLALGDGTKLRLAFSRDVLTKTTRRLQVTLGVVALSALVIALIVGRVLARRVTAPLNELAVAMTRLEARSYDEHLAGTGRGDEIDVIVRRFNEMARNLRETEADLLQAERMAAWRDVARKIAHEIKNPLFPMQLAVQNLQSSYRRQLPAFDDMFEENTGTVLEQIRRLNSIVSEFSSFARMPLPNLQREDLIEVIRQVIRLYDEVEEGVTFELTTCREFLPLDLDRDQMTQVFVNLVKNAIEAMEGTGTLAITISEDGNAPNPVSVLVRDSGPGIPEGMLEKVFVPYASSKESGSGLGMAISQKIVVEHGGSMTVRNHPDGGAEFMLRFPRPEGSQHPQKPDRRVPGRG